MWSIIVVPIRPKVESSDAVIIGIILVCDQSDRTLFDPRSTSSYVFAYAP